MRGARWDPSHEVQPCTPATLCTVKIWKRWLGAVHTSHIDKPTRVLITGRAA